MSYTVTKQQQQQQPAVQPLIHKQKYSTITQKITPSAVRLLGQNYTTSPGQWPSRYSGSLVRRLFVRRTEQGPSLWLSWG